MADTTYQIYSRFIDPMWIQPLRPSLHGREIAYPNPFVVGDGISNINTQKINEMGPPIVQFAENDFDGQSKDSIGFTPVVVKPVKIIEPFKIPRDLFNAFVNGNNIQMPQSINLAANYAYSAAYKVAQMENSIIFNGWAPDGSNILVDGFLSGAGTTDTTTAYLFGKFNEASKCAADLISAVNDAGADPAAFNFSMNPGLYNTVNAVTSTAGVREMDNLVKVLNPAAVKDGTPMVGRCIKDFTLPYNSTSGIGSVLLTPVDPTRTWIELYITVDYRSLLSPAATLPELKPLEGAVYCQMAPHIKQANALAAATNVSKAAA
jgi:hypothetical protein